MTPTGKNSPPTGHFPMTAAEELREILLRRFPAATLTHTETIPARKSVTAPWPDWVDEEIKQALYDELDITTLWSHQAEVANLAHEGTHVVVTTGTSSGKSLGYLLPVLQRLKEDPDARALYITPAKALGHDQVDTFTTLCEHIKSLHDVYPSPYDGDTPKAARQEIRGKSRLIVTNPDMLHLSILARHDSWARFFKNLRYIVIDECHSYRGVFGAHVSWVLSRLLRLADYYSTTPTQLRKRVAHSVNNPHQGTIPTVILASATTGAPVDHAKRLTGLDITGVGEDGAPAGQKTILLWEASLSENAAERTKEKREHQSETGEQQIRISAAKEAAKIMAITIAEGARTLTFTRSRQQAETVALQCQEHLMTMGRPQDAKRIASYRAGYLAEDRRRLERQLDDGELLGVAATNALELGIDVGGLDAVIEAGYPGTVASFFQQAGRAGRRGQSALVVLVARSDPLDTYLVRHPEALLSTPVEQAVFNRDNPTIAAGHLYCAAVEKPLTKKDLDFFGKTALPIVESLVSEGLLRQRNSGWFAVERPADVLPKKPRPSTAHASVAIRGGGRDEIAVIRTTDSALLETVDLGRALSQVHDGAVHLNHGNRYLIESLDLAQHIAWATPLDQKLSTAARTDTSITITGIAAGTKPVNPAPGLWVSLVDVDVTDTVTGYVMKLPDGTITQQVPLDYPPQVLSTRAVAYTIDPLITDELGISRDALPGTLHAAEHAAIGLLPLVASCDRWDIGGVSTALHEDTGLPTVFVYDGYEGGAGFADHAFTVFSTWIEATWKAVKDCSCESGCPSCVQSPKCGNGNDPLDKAGAVKLLGGLVSMLGYWEDQLLLATKQDSSNG